MLNGSEAIDIGNISLNPFRGIVHWIAEPIRNHLPGWSHLPGCRGRGLWQPVEVGLIGHLPSRRALGPGLDEIDSPLVRRCASGIAVVWCSHRRG